jgi:DNA-directed RNA polymerase beta subunit
VNDPNGELCNALQNVSDMAQDALVKLSQEYIGARESDRRFSKLWFKGKIKAQDGQKAWAYVTVHSGLCSAAFDSLRSEGIDCKPHYDNPHISFIRKEEVEELKKKFGTKWRSAVKEGQPIRFALERIVHLIPKGWDDVDRVWFLEVDSPDLRKIRISLGLTELPMKDGQHLRFHVTFAIRKSITKVAAELMGEIAKATDPNITPLTQTSTEHGVKLQEVFDKMEVDPNVTMKTLGAEYTRVNPAMLIRTSQKLLNINKGTESTDDRDSLAFQIIHGPEDFFAERISKDAGQIARKLLWKATLRSNLDHVPSGALTPQLRGVLINSGMAQPLEEINPFDAHDQSQKVLRLGEGAIPSIEAVPDEARNVQNSHLGYVDPVRSPESEKIGVDSRITHRLMKGSDGRLYAPMTDARTSQEKLVSAEEASESIIAFPGEMASDRKKVRAMVRSGKVSFVGRDQVDFALPSHTQMFSSSVNLIPMVGAIKGGRALMGGKYPTQSLPLRDPEAPLVRSVDENGKTFVNLLGVHMGAVRSDAPGVVEKVTADEIVVRTPEGRKSFELMHNFPYNRKTYNHNTPVVKIGDQIAPGQLLASSNFTDTEGNMAVGKNLRVGYLAYKGLNYEDASVLSESAARRMSSEHMYQHPLEPEEGTEIGRKEFVSLYPGQFNATQLKMVDEKGIARPGTRVKKGDPLILAVKRTIPTKLSRSNKPIYVPSAVVWEHEAEGVVTDASETKDGGYNVAVKAYMPLQEGDKLAGFYGDKGVVGRILPDDNMPRDAEGRPLEVILNPLGVLARNNTAQVYEALLGRVAVKTGKPIDVPAFMGESLIDYVQKQLKDNKLNDTEDLEDPETGRKIPAVLTGTRYLMKLHHTAEAKSGGRDIGSYTAEGVPAKGGDSSSKRIGTMETNALISHGATEVLKDAKIIRGQRNDDFWRAFRLGYPPPSPKVPFVYEKFMASLQGAGVNVKKDGNRLHLFALTDKDVDELSAGAIQSADTVEGDDFKPVAGGLFDEGLTGGAGGNRWSHIQLTEPMPNPVMEEPIRRLLGMTKNNYRDVIAGKKELWGKTGGEAVKTALGKLSVESEMKRYEDILRHGPRSKRDDAAKALGYLKTVQDKGINMQDWVMNKWPVLPPAMRPITVMRKMQMVADPNYLYRDLFYANSDLSEIKGVVGSNKADNERLRVYDGLRAVAGLGDPIQAKTQEKNVKGLLQHVFGSTPKVGMYQRRVLNSAVDVVGRATITPNPELGMDQVGLPESKAWTIYRPFIIRNLVRRGMPSAQAAIEVVNQSKTARDALVDETSKRPVIINRAPTLHRYGFMSAWPVLVKNDTLQLPPPIVAGFNADFDGDAMNYHVPVSDEAVKDAVEKMMPSRNLKSVRDFKVHYLPRHEFMMGLFLASRAKSEGKPRVFRSKEDVVAAYQRGDIGIGDKVVVGG